MILERFGIAISNDTENSVWLFEPDLINVHDLLRRWDGLWDEDLIEMICKGKLPAYYKSKHKNGRRRSIDGKVMYLCTPSEYSNSLVFKGLTFRIDDVELLERQSPELERRLRNSANSQSPVPPGILKMEIEKLKTLTDDLDGRIVKIQKHVEEVNAENAGLREELERLQTENVRLKGDLETECLKSQTAPPKPPKTAAASEAASNLKAEEWKGHVGHLVKIALQCGQEGPKPRRRPQLQFIAKQHGGELPGTVLNALWAALPEDHKSKEPGAPKQY